MAPHVYQPYTHALIEQRRKRLIALGYRPASPPTDSVVRNVPVFRFHGKYYYRPHYCTVLAQAASIQIHKESYIDLEKMPPDGMRLRTQPQPPTAEKLRLLDFIHGAPKSWWKSLDQYRGHIMLLQQVAGEGTKGNENLLMNWLLKFTGSADVTTG